MTDQPKVDGETTEKVEIVMRPAVGWFSVRLLIATGLQAFITLLTGPRSARREVLAALDDGEETPDADSVRTAEGFFDFRNDPEKGHQEIWVDYAADLGDGFDSTHSVSWLLGRDYLFFKDDNDPTKQPLPPNSKTEAAKDALPDAAHVLPAGNVLVFGGDQVYPSATQQDYQERTIGPYYAARPWSAVNTGGPDDGGRRMLFTIPGNHDWYDGLSSFIKNFCQPGRWIGCWQVQQKRSYFSLRLPHGFWIWGLDLATDDEIDPPQIEYFERQATQLKQGDQVVLCVPKPAWLELEAGATSEKRKRKSWDSWEKVNTVIDLVTRNKKVGATVPLMIAGDNHYYAHHASLNADHADARHYVTCGGGGAFTLGTTAVPATLAFPDDSEARNQEFFPSVQESKDLRTGVFKLVYRHKFFCALMSSLLLGFIWLIHTSSLGLLGTSSKRTSSPVIEAPFLDTARDALSSWSNLGTLFGDFFAIMIYRPGVLAAFIALALGFFAFASTSSSSRVSSLSAGIVGILHFVVQLVIAIAITASLAASFIEIEASLLSRIIGYLILGVSLGLLFHGVFLSFYIWASNRLTGMHEQEIYSSQAIEDWKCFLRMRINHEGLTVFPVGLKRAVRHWKPVVSSSETERPETTKGVARRMLDQITPNNFSLAVPEETTHLFDPEEPIAPELIEEPFTIKSKSGVNV